jgi:hypothetical protein
MEALMNRGDNCVVPALVYLFNYIEKKFDGRLTLLVLDEAWLFLKNETFSEKITEWLKVLRKKNVYVVFATQEIADVANSPLKTTIIQQCFTKIYLADPSALDPGMMGYYQEFGLTDSEISLIASADRFNYFYTSPLGRRLFQLDLGQLTLALIGTPDHALLDELASKYELASALCAEIIDAKNISYKYFLDEYAPVDPEPVPRRTPIKIQDISLQVTEQQEEPALEEIPDSPGNSELLEAVSALPERKKNDGSGRAAAAIVDKFKVSLSTVYQIRAILKNGTPELVDALRNNDIPVKTAYKRLRKEKIGEPEQIAG